MLALGWSVLWHPAVAPYKHRHKATLWILFTQPAAQGQGVGRHLLELAIDQCKRDSELEQIQLSIGSESRVARHLSTSVGFLPYGIEPLAMKLGNRYLDVELMLRSVIDDTNTDNGPQASTAWTEGPGWGAALVGRRLAIKEVATALPRIIVTSARLSGGGTLSMSKSIIFTPMKMSMVPRAGLR